MNAQHEDWVVKHATIPWTLTIPEEMVVFVMVPETDKQADFSPITDPTMRDLLFTKRQELSQMNLETLFLNPMTSIEKIKSYLHCLPLSTGSAITFYWNHTSSTSALLDRVCLTYNLGCLYMRAARLSGSIESLDIAARVFDHLYAFITTQSFVNSADKVPKIVTSGSHNIILSWPEEETVQDASIIASMAHYMMRLCLAIECQLTYQQMITNMTTIPPKNVAPEKQPLIKENLMWVTNINLTRNYWLPLHQLSSDSKSDKTIESSQVILPEMVRHYRHFTFAAFSCTLAMTTYHACRIILLNPNDIKRIFNLDNNFSMEHYRGLLLSQLRSCKMQLTDLIKSISTRTLVSSVKGKLLMQKSKDISLEEQFMLESCLQVLTPLISKLETYVSTISLDPIPLSLPGYHFTQVVLPVAPHETKLSWFYEIQPSLSIQTVVSPLVTMPSTSLFDKIKSSIPFLNTNNVPSISGSMFDVQQIQTPVTTQQQTFVTMTDPVWQQLLKSIHLLVEKREMLKPHLPPSIMQELETRETMMLGLLQQPRLPAMLFNSLVMTVEKEAQPFYERVSKAVLQ